MALPRFRTAMRRIPRGRVPLAALVLAAVLVLVGVSLAFLTPRQATVTLSAAPAGHISPEGEVHQAAGSRLTITVWSDDAAMKPGLLLGDKAVTPLPDGHDRYTYTFVVTEDTTVQASFVQLADNVRPLPPGSANAIISVSPDRTEVVLSDRADFAAQLAVDDILLNSSDSGYKGSLLVRILGIQRDPGRITLRTEPAPLTAAVVKASIRAKVPLQLQAASAQSAPPTGMVGPQPAFAGEAIRKGVSVDLGSTFAEDGGAGSVKATLAGNITLNAVLEVNLDIDWGNVRLLEVALSESLTASASLDVEAQAHLADAITILKIDLPPVPLAPFVVLTPKIEVGAGVDITADGHLNLAGSFEEEIRVGMRYEHGQWSPIDEERHTASGSVTVDASATARAYPSVRLAADIDGLCGGYVEVQPGFLELTADIHANPWWKLDAGLHAAVGARCFFTDDWELASGDVARATIKDAGGPFLVADAPIATSASTSVPQTPSAAPTITWASVARTGCYVADARSASAPAPAPADGLLPSDPSVPAGVGPVELYGSDAGMSFTLAPAGWGCTLEIFKNGAARLIVSPTPGSSSSPSHIEVSDSGWGSLEERVSIACPWFAEAGQVDPSMSTCGESFSSPGVGKQVTRLSPTLIRYEQPNTIGIVEFHAWEGESAPNARSIECSLPPDQFGLCPAVLRVWQEPHDISLEP